ncbi:MAG: NAD(P)/FAD-dependent oxidoreductase [Nocardioides sp.]
MAKVKTPAIDLLVVGGGPAGLATALHAHRAGLEVRIWESRAGTVDKACGEGLMPGAVAALAELGVHPMGHPLLGIHYLGSGREARADFRAGPGLGVRRTTLHDALAEAVAATGIVVEHRRATELLQHEHEVVVDDLRARYVVAADGLHSPLRRQLGLDVRPLGSQRQHGRARHGLRRHFALAPWSSHVEVHWGRHAEAYVTPVADDLVGVAVLSARTATYDEHLADFPALRARLEGTEAVDSVRGAGPLRQGARRRSAGRVLLVGDAAGYVDALTGEGVALALAQAGAAVEAVVRGDPEHYERAWVSLTRRYRWLTAGLLLATRPAPLRRALVPAARLLPPVFDLAVNALARPVETTPNRRRHASPTRD